MGVGATDNLRSGHARFERFKYLGERRMKDLTSKLPEFGVLGRLVAGYR
jgi:hypothetical protein